MITLEYGDDFYFKERNWNCPQIKITFYVFKNNQIKITNHITTYCKCK